jgi:hypothetical protein
MRVLGSWQYDTATVLHGVFCCTQPQRRDLIAKKTSLSQVVERKREGFEAAVSHR